MLSSRRLGDDNGACFIVKNASGFAVA